MISNEPVIKMTAIVKRVLSAIITEKKLDTRFGEAKTIAGEAPLATQSAVVEEVARVIASPLDIQLVYEEFAKQLRRLVDFDRISIALVDRDSGTIAYRYRFGQTPSGPDQWNVIPLKGTRMERVLMTGRTLVTADVSSRSEFESDQIFSTVRLLASMHTPLFYRGLVFGAVALRSTNVASFGPREQAMIELRASQITPAIRNAQVYERSKQVEIELRESEAGARAQIESAPQGIIVTSRAGDIVQVNGTALKIFWYTLEELVGKPVSILVPQDSRVAHGGLRESYFTDPVARPMGKGRELHGSRKDGSLGPLEKGWGAKSPAP